MANGKVGGPNGIPVNFYKIFWSKIKLLLLEVFNFCQKEGRLFESARQGIISLIPKPEKNRSYLKNWRPIALLNVDYKILSKAIATRIKLVLDHLIDEDQTGFRKGRDISENLRKMFDIMEVIFTQKIPAIMVMVNFEKAFDRVEIPSLLKIMRIMNFGKNILDWIQLLFCNFNLAVSNFRYLSNFIRPTRSLFQGNPIAPYLFLIVGEALCRLLKINDKIKGLRLAGMSVLLSQFADDLTLFLEHKESVWQAVMDTFLAFERLSGMKINYEKTTIYRIGSLKDSNATFYSRKKIIWTNEPVKVLGIWIHYDLDRCFRLNYEPLIEKTNSILESWGRRGLSLIGKIEVLNALIGSLFVYKMSVLPRMPNKYL